MRKYTTVSGDMFDLVAKKELGDELYVTEVLGVNLDKADIIFFPAGVELNIPATPGPIPDETLPPWKRDE